MQTNFTPEQLANRSWWEGPELYLVIDDLDLVGEIADRFGAQVLVLSLDVTRAPGTRSGVRTQAAPSPPRGGSGERGGIAALAVPWTSIPAGWVAVLPLVDIVAIALMRQADPIGGSGCSGCSRRCGSPRSGVPGSSRAASSSRRCTGR